MAEPGGYLGRLLDAGGQPRGTCFQVAPALLVTAHHVLEALEAAFVGAEVSVDPLGGGRPSTARVQALDRLHDLAVLRRQDPLPASVAGLVRSEVLHPETPIRITGVPQLQDRYEYRYVHSSGTWEGVVLRGDDVRLGQATAPKVVPGMSGAPVRLMTNDRVAGILSSRYNSATQWMQHTVWVTRLEDLLPLLSGQGVDVQQLLAVALDLVDLLLAAIMSEVIGRATGGALPWRLDPEYEARFRRVIVAALDEAIAEVAAGLDGDAARQLHRAMVQGFTRHDLRPITTAEDMRSALERWITELAPQGLGTAGFDAGQLSQAIFRRIIARMTSDALAGGLIGSTAQWLWRPGEPASVAGHAGLVEAARIHLEASETGERGTGPIRAYQSSGGLPAQAQPFVGRADALAAMAARVLRHDPSGPAGSVHVIHGMAGIGKTAFAMEVARAHTDRYPDHLLFLDLQGNTPGVEPMRVEAALEQLLRDIGEPTTTIPAEPAARMARWRSVMARRRSILVLDNASDAEQVIPLLPAAIGCLVLITSRRRLAAVLAAVPFELGLLPEDEMTAFFREAVGDRAITADDLATTVAACAGVPLAAMIIVARLRSEPIAVVHEIAQDLADATERLYELSPEDLGVRAAFAVSVRRLPRERARMFDMLGWHPGPSVSAVPMAVMADVPLRAARRLLHELADQHLLEADLDAGPESRYHLHDLLRLFARERATEAFPAAERSAAERRLARFYRTCLVALDRVNGLAQGEEESAATARYGVTLSAPEESRRWFAAERENIAAFAPAATGADAVEMCLIAGGHTRRSGRYIQGRDLYQRAYQEATRIGDRLRAADAVRYLADIDRLTGRYQDARDGYQSARQMYKATGHGDRVAAALRGLADVANLLGDHAAAAANYAAAYDAYSEIGNQLGMANASHGMGNVARMRGDYPAAQQQYSSALATYLRLGNQLGEAHARLGLADTEFARGRGADADAHYRAALALYTTLGDPRGIADTVRGIAHLDRVSGDLAGARDGFERVRDIYLHIGDDLGRATALWGLGQVAQASGLIDEATLRWREALEVYERIDAPDVDRVRTAIRHLTGAGTE
jgi:tetratricopeptide (TPR) repeat protein